MSLILVSGIVIVLLAAGILLTAMISALASLSPAYVRHWARRQDPTAKQIYPLKAKGSAVVVTLELLRAMVIVAAIVVMAVTLWPPLAWLLASLVLFLVVLLLPAVYLKSTGVKLLVLTSGLLMSLTTLLRPMTGPLGRWLDKHGERELPMSTITKAELASLLKHTRASDTDIGVDELRLLRHVLSYGELTVHDIMTPKSVVRSVREDDILSPVLLDELHKSGHSRFPVIGAAKDQVIGMLYIHDLIELKAHSRVGEVMSSKVYFVHEERELDHVLNAFLRTKRHLFIVVNAFAEITGLITIEDILEQIIGKPIVDEFDRFDDMRAVAKQQARQVTEQLQADQKVVE